MQRDVSHCIDVLCAHRYKVLIFVLLGFFFCSFGGSAFLFFPAGPSSFVFYTCSSASRSLLVLLHRHLFNSWGSPSWCGRPRHTRGTLVSFLARTRSLFLIQVTVPLASLEGNSVTPVTIVNRFALPELLFLLQSGRDDFHRVLPIWKFFYLHLRHSSPNLQRDEVNLVCAKCDIGNVYGLFFQKYASYWTV